MLKIVTDQPDQPATADQLVKEYLDIRAIAEGASARALEIDNASRMPFPKVQFGTFRGHDGERYPRYANDQSTLDQYEQQELLVQKVCRADDAAAARTRARFGELRVSVSTQCTAYEAAQEARRSTEANAVADLAWERADRARELMLKHVPASLAEIAITARLLLVEAEVEVIPEHDVNLFLRALARLA